LHSPGATLSNDNGTFNKDIMSIDAAKVNVATTKLADIDPAQHNGILERKQVDNDCDGGLVVLVTPSVNEESKSVPKRVID
jgi:hypothetical protein